MNDTSPEFEAMVDERYRRMTPDERVKIAASMYAPPVPSFYRRCRRV